MGLQAARRLHQPQLAAAAGQAVPGSLADARQALQVSFGLQCTRPVYRLHLYRGQAPNATAVHLLRGQGLQGRLALPCAQADDQPRQSQTRASMQASPVAHVSTVVHASATWRASAHQAAYSPQLRASQAWMKALVHSLVACLQVPAAGELESPLEQASFELLADAFLKPPQGSGQQGPAGPVLPVPRLELLHCVLGTCARRWLKRWAWPVVCGVGHLMDHHDACMAMHNMCG